MQTVCEMSEVSTHLILNWTVQLPKTYSHACTAGLLQCNAASTAAEANAYLPVTQLTAFAA